MRIFDIIEHLSTNLSSFDIRLYPPANEQQLINFEYQLKCPLPEIAERLSESKSNCFHFAEDMTYCDMWEIEINPSNPNEYWISNHGTAFRLLTKSLAEFLKRFLAKGVFEDGGLYTWHDEIDTQNKSHF
jgi:hypothetical protein